MKLMKKFMKKHEGFTLVELIVVIAILAILAGVAIPVYSGYIKKANSAADLQLLDAVNGAFAAACAENGMSHQGIQEPVDIPLIDAEEGSDEKKVNLANIRPAELKEAFARYFAGNENSVFKTYKSLRYIYKDGTFVGSESVEADVDTGYRVSVEEGLYIFQTNGNSYKDNEEELVNKVSNFATAFSGFIDDEAKKEKLLADEEFKALCEKHNIDTTDPNELAQAVTLYAAQGLSDVNPNSVHNALLDTYNPGGFNLLDFNTAMNGEDTTPAEMVVNGATLAAVIAGYANSEYGKDNQAVQDAFAELDGVTNATTLLNKLNAVIYAGQVEEDGVVTEDSFAKYLESAQAGKDLEAVAGGLAAVHGNADDILASGDPMDYILDMLKNNQE